MKIVLGCLMCVILPLSQAVAIDGGPDYGRAQVRTTGTYAGVLYPRNVSNSIGLFTVTIPKVGLGTGTVFIFATEEAYDGTMQGTADPDSAAVTGFIDAGFNFLDKTATGTDKDGNPTYTVTVVRAVAAGQVRGRVRANTVFSTASARLGGHAQIEFTPQFNTPPNGIIYSVVGFKQQEIQ